MTYHANISWTKDPSEAFTDNKYSREHKWVFDGGIEVKASSSPHVVPLPHSVEDAVDPEEAFAASLSSCHMLWFLSIAASEGFVVEKYVDEAEGVLAKDENGKLAMTNVRLSPQTTFSGSRLPTRQQIEELHHRAHSRCFIANSVRTSIEITPR